MSTLTKILIVVLSLASIFLCGTIVTYVGTAKNYKAAYEQQNTELTSLKHKNQNYQQQLEEKKTQLDELNKKLDTEMAAVNVEKSQLQTQLKNIEREKLANDEKIEKLTAAALNFDKTVGGMEESLKQTRAELDDARAENIKLGKNLNELTASLEEKMAQLASLDTEKKRLLEEKTKLEDKISGNAVSYQPVTQMPNDSATAAIETAVDDVPLQGVITAVQGSLVTLSIGTADGVGTGMIFHIIRNDSFICDVKITDTDTEACAGTIQLVSSQPQVGDIASTTW